MSARLIPLHANSQILAHKRIGHGSVRQMCLSRAPPRSRCLLRSSWRLTRVQKAGFMDAFRLAAWDAVVGKHWAPPYSLLACTTWGLSPSVRALDRRLGVGTGRCPLRTKRTRDGGRDCWRAKLRNPSRASPYWVLSSTVHIHLDKFRKSCSALDADFVR
jgi:hypothetical protein